MVSGVRLWIEGGDFMYIILACGLFHLVLCVVEGVTRGRHKLTTLLLCSLASMVLLGFLGMFFGLIATFDAVASASAEMKQTLLAAGIAVSMFSTIGSLMFAILGVWGIGIASLFKKHDEPSVVPAVTSNVAS